MIWTAFILGLFGSLHCLGMCGPIALSLPGNGGGRWNQAVTALEYNLGRTVSYMLIGGLFGIFGQGLRLAGLQSFLSVTMGILILLFAFFTLDFENKIARNPLIQRFFFTIKSRLSVLLSGRTGRKTWLIGFLNGFLPCGLVYAALFGAVSTGSMLQSMAFMLLFGLGTIPLMFSVAFFGRWMNISYRNTLRKIVPAFLTIMAILLIMRGLHFELPYHIRFWQMAADQPMCH